MKNHIAIKLGKLAEVIAIRCSQGIEPARNFVATDRGKAAMDALRSKLAAMQEEERNLLKIRFEDTENGFDTVVGSGVVSAFLAIFLAVTAAALVRRSTVAMQEQHWVRSGPDLPG